MKIEFTKKESDFMLMKFEFTELKFNFTFEKCIFTHTNVMICDGAIQRYNLHLDLANFDGLISTSTSIKPILIEVEVGLNNRIFTSNFLYTTCISISTLIF